MRVEAPSERVRSSREIIPTLFSARLLALAGMCRILIEVGEQQSMQRLTIDYDAPVISSSSHQEAVLRAAAQRQCGASAKNTSVRTLCVPVMTRRSRWDTAVGREHPRRSAGGHACRRCSSLSSHDVDERVYRDTANGISCDHSTGARIPDANCLSNDDYSQCEFGISFGKMKLQVGANFGPDEPWVRRRIRIGSSALEIDAAQAIIFDNQLNVDLPEGDSRNNDVQIEVWIEGREEDLPPSLPTTNATFDYDPPVVHEVRFPESNSRGCPEGKRCALTDSCQRHTATMKKPEGDIEDESCRPENDPENDVRCCVEYARVELHGENFGIVPPNVTIGGVSTPAFAGNSHEMVVARLPPGMGIVDVAITAGFHGNAQSHGLRRALVYSKPTMIDAKWGVNPPGARIQGEFDAIGSALTGNRLFLFGSNFGPVASNVTVSLGTGSLAAARAGTRALRMLSLRDSPYLSCEPEPTVVGPINVYIDVAGVNNTFTYLSDGRTVDARCGPNYYGLTGEYCIECWHYFADDVKIYAANCSGIFDRYLDVDGGTEESSQMPATTSFPPPECTPCGKVCSRLRRMHDD